jgi:transposase
VLHRALKEWGYACDVIAPSLIPKRPGVQRKHDKRDAVDLARFHRAGELVVVRIPSEADERVRDVVRCRETFQREILKSRHYILKFLARRGFVFREGTNWCTPHLKWLQHLTTDGSPLAVEDRLVFREYHALLMYKLQRDELDRQIEQLALLPALAPLVGRLQCFRGISLHSAMVLATEIVDWRRFERPAQLACYLGLVSREDSSGDRTRLGSITKAGNTHCRHVLVQAAWSYRHRPLAPWSRTPVARIPPARAPVPTRSAAVPTPFLPWPTRAPAIETPIRPIDFRELAHGQPAKRTGKIGIDGAMTLAGQPADAQVVSLCPFAAFTPSLTAR